MPSYTTQEDHFWRNLSTHGLLIALCSVLIVWLMPSHASMPVEANVGTPWQMEDLRSDIEFDVMKSDEAIAQEKEEKLVQRLVLIRVYIKDCFLLHQL